MRRPILKSILICDQIIEDIVTRKKTLVGVFERLISPTFPIHHGNLGVFFQIVDAEGEYNFSLELADVENNITMGVAHLPTAKVESPVQVSNFALMFQGLRFEHPGVHEFRLWVGNELIGQHALNVLQVDKETQ